MIAAEIHLEESLWLSDMVRADEPSMDMPEDMKFFAEEFPRLMPQQHGHVFKHMYNPDDDMNLDGFVIASVLFDERGYFSGFNLMDTWTGDLMVLSPLQAGTGGLNNIDNHMDLIKGNPHTRLVGFRTTKRCESDNNIMSVQPIYYSIDEQMCKKTLK